MYLGTGGGVRVCTWEQVGCTCVYLRTGEVYVGVLGNRWGVRGCTWEQEVVRRYRP